MNLGETYTLRSSEQQSSLSSDLIDGWKIDWGDGNIDTVSGDPGSFTHLYAKPGGYVIAATASATNGPLDQEQIQNVSVVRPDPFLLIEATESVQETQAVVLHPQLHLFSETALSNYRVEWGDGVIEHYPLDATSFSHVYPIDSLIMPHLHYYDAFTLAPIPVPPQYLETQYGIHVSLETTGGVVGAASEATLSGTAHVDGYTPIDTYSGAQLPWPGDPRMWDHTTGYPSVIDGHVLDVADMVANESCYPGYGQTVNYQLDWGDGSTEDHTVQVYTNEYTSHLYRHEGLYVVNARFENGSQSATMIGVGWVKTGLSGVAPQSVTPNSGVTVTATVHGLDIRDLLTDGGSLKNYAFVDWGDGLGKVPAQLTVDADGNGSVSAHYDHVPAGGLAGTLYVYDEHGNEFETDFSVKADLPAATLTVGVAETDVPFTPMYLKVPGNFNPANATFTFTYSASNPANDSQSGSGTDADPYVYTPAPGDFTIWTQDGTGPLRSADFHNGGDFLNSGVAYSMSSLTPANWVAGSGSYVFYVEGVGAPISKAAGSITVSISTAQGPATAGATEPRYADAINTNITTSAPSYNKTNKEHAYDDAKQEIARLHGFDPNNWAAIEYHYLSNDHGFRDQVDALAPGKERYYDNLQKAVAASVPLPTEVDAATTSVSIAQRFIDGSWTLTKTTIDLVRPHPIDMFNAATAQANILFDPNQPTLNRVGGGFGVAGNTILLVTDLVPGVGFIARKLGLKAGTKIAEVVVEKGAVATAEKVVEKGAVSATEGIIEAGEK